MVVRPPPSCPSPTASSRPSPSRPGTRLLAARPSALSSSTTRVYPASTQPSPAMSQHYHVYDAGSLNGTFVNGRRVPADTATRLHAGDELRFADLRFRFLSGPAGQSHPPPARLRFDDAAAEVYVECRPRRLGPEGVHAASRAVAARRARLLERMPGSGRLAGGARASSPMPASSPPSVASAASSPLPAVAAPGYRPCPRQGYRLAGDEE